MNFKQGKPFTVKPSWKANEEAIKQHEEELAKKFKMFKAEKGDVFDQLEKGLCNLSLDYIPVICHWFVIVTLIFTMDELTQFKGEGKGRNKTVCRSG